MRKFVCQALFVLSPLILVGQVGVNTANPSKASVLELNDTERGFLPPRLTRLQRENMINQHGPLPAGLIVYDTDDQMYYYYNPSNGDGNNTGGDQNWQALSPFTYKDDKSDFQSPNYMRTIETHKSVKGVSLFVNTITSIVRRLWVKGGVSISATNVAPPADFGLYVQGNSSFGGNVAVTGNVSANTLAGIGTVPVGGIIAWDGGAIPTGWALCDGGGGRPDLRDKFVLGAGGSEPTLGGSRYVSLSTANLPSHSHSINISGTTSSNGSHTHSTNAPNHYGSESGGDDEYAGGDGVARRATIGSAGAHQHDFTVSGVTANSGGGNPIDLMPPYVTLRYIIRVF